MTNPTFFCFITLLMMVVGTARAEIRTDFLMDTDPACVPLPPIKILVMPRHLELWLAALGRPEIDLQRMSAESIAIASEEGIAGMSEAVPRLEEILLAESTHPAARFSAARALVVLNSRSSAEKLFQASQNHGADLRQFVEPALAKWDFGPIKAVWVKRLAAPSQRTRDFMLAVRGIRQVHETSSQPALRAIIFDLVLTPDIRLEAATALGQLAQTGLEVDADRLIHEKRASPVVNRNCAIRLLAHHDSESTRRLLTELAGDAEPSVIAAALQRLNDIDPVLVVPLADEKLKNADVNVRQQAARAYVSLPTIERIRPLAQLLDDPHPALRRHICEDIKLLSEKPALNETVRSAVMEILNGTGWRGQEQASLLLGQLEHLPASKRLLELLESDRKEVQVSTAWGLRKIADPQTTAGMLDKIRRQTIARKTKTSNELDWQVAHLFEACGRIRAKEAEPLMLEYVPKNLVMGERSRGAAIYALGRLHEGTPDTKLGSLLNERINDFGTPPMEFDMVRQQSIITIGRMKAIAYAAEFRIPLEKGTPNGAMYLARRWAIQEMTGERLPDPTPDTINVGGWFLEPIVPPKTE